MASESAQHPLAAPPVCQKRQSIPLLGSASSPVSQVHPGFCGFRLFAVGRQRLSAYDATIPTHHRETNMNRYQTQTPRTAFAIAAVVLSLATFGAFVGAPSKLDAADGAFMVARATHATHVTISPARIDVVASRESPVTVAVVSDPHTGR